MYAISQLFLDVVLSCFAVQLVMHPKRFGLVSSAVTCAVTDQGSPAVS